MIYPIVKKNSGCDYHRLYLPFKYLGVPLDEQALKKPSENIREASVVVFNRWAGYEIEKLLYLRKQFKFKIVCDLDDYWELYSNHVLSTSWRESQMQRKIKEAIFNADLVTVTTTRLADVVRKYNKNIEIIPNGIPFDDGQFSYNQGQSEIPRIIYTSGSSHFWDLLNIKNLFYKLSRTNIAKNLEIALAGYDDRNTASKKIWDGMEKMISASGKLNYIRQGTLPLYNYMDHYNGSSIAIAPLEGNYFNQFKSNLKIIEAGCKNIPIIVSNVPPYSDEDCPFVLKANTVNEWYDHIKRLVENPFEMYALGKQLGNYVREKYDLRKINELRRQIFEFYGS